MTETGKRKRTTSYQVVVVKNDSEAADTHVVCGRVQGVNFQIRQGDRSDNARSIFQAIAGSDVKSVTLLDDVAIFINPDKSLTISGSVPAGYHEIVTDGEGF